MLFLQPLYYNAGRPVVGMRLRDPIKVVRQSTGVVSVTAISELSGADATATTRCCVLHDGTLTISVKVCTVCSLCASAFDACACSPCLRALPCMSLCLGRRACIQGDRHACKPFVSARHLVCTHEYKPFVSELSVRVSRAYRSSAPRPTPCSRRSALASLRNGCASMRRR